MNNSSKAKKLPNRAKYSKSKAAEPVENGILLTLLGNRVMPQITGGNDDFPNIDGYIHLLDKERGITGQSLQIQIKPLSRSSKGVYSTFRPTLLTHAHDSTAPVLLIGVDIDTSEAYWLYLSPELVDSLDNVPETGVTLYFPNKNKVLKNDESFLKEWKKVCDHHQNKSNDKIVSKYIRDLQKKSTGQGLTIEKLETLKQLAFYRTNDGQYPLVDLLLNLAEDVKRGDLGIKTSYLEILKQLVYQKTEEVVAVLASFLKDEELVSEVEKIFLEVAKYNIHVLNNIGYKPQRILVDLVPNLLATKNPKQKKLAIDIAQKLLDPSFDGTSNPTIDSITLHHGTLPVTPYLEKIRKDAIDLLLDIAKNEEDAGIRTRAVEALYQAFHMPDWGFANKEEEKNFRDLLDREAHHIVKKYKGLVFGKDGQPISVFPIVYEVETQLVMLKVWERSFPELEEVLGRLRSSKNDYYFYKLFAGDDQDLYFDENFGDAPARENKEGQVLKALDSISDGNIKEWYLRLETIASFQGALKNNWKFISLRLFLNQFAIRKPDLADKLLEEIFENKGHLYDFAGNLIANLRGSSFELWDKYISKIKVERSTDLTVSSILVSFEIEKDGLVPRKKDAAMVEDIAEAKNEFSFLDKENISLRAQMIRTIGRVYEYDPVLFRRILINQIKNYPALDHVIFDAIGSELHWKRITLDGWSDDETKELADLLVRSPVLDYNHEKIIYEIGEKDFDLMMSIYYRRLKEESKKTDARYEAFPYHFSNDITKLISSHPNYPVILKTWILEVNERHGVYPMRLGKLVHKIGGHTLSRTFEGLIQGGSEKDLEKIIALFPLVEVPNFDICFKIVAATDNENIWRGAADRMRTTGCLSGKYGDNLHGNALRSIKSKIEQESNSTDNARIKKFCEQEIRRLEAEIEFTDRRHEKELREHMEEFKERHDDEDDGWN